MSFTVKSLIENKKDINVTNVPIKWSFNIISENETKSIEKEGTFNISSTQNLEPIIIPNAKSDIDSYFQSCSELIFTDSGNNTKFILNLGRATNFEKLDEIIEIHFKFHGAIPQLGFEINDPITSGVATISSEESILSDIEKVFRENLFIDNEYMIPRCGNCEGLKSISGKTDSVENLIDSDFICSDCYTSANNYCNILITEFEKPLIFDNLKQQRPMLLDLIAGGKQNAESIMESQLSHFYDVFYVFIEYLVGIFPQQETSFRLNKLRELCSKKEYNKLENYVELILEKVESYKLPEQEEKTSQPHPDEISEELKANDVSTEIIKEKPLNTDYNSLIEQTLHDLAEALSSLDVLEPDLKPRPVTPLDRLKFVNSLIHIESEEEEEVTRKPLHASFNNDIDVFDDLDLKPIMGKEIHQKKPKKIEVVDDFNNTLPEDEMKLEESLGDDIPDHVMEKIQVLDEFSESKEIPEAITEILENKKAKEETEQSAALNNENEEELESQNSVNSPGAPNPPPGLTPPGTPNPPPGLTPPGTPNPPPGLTPPGALNPPPGLTPPGAPNPPPGLTPPGAPNPPPGLTPPGAPNPPPGFNPPKKSSEL